MSFKKALFKNKYLVLIAPIFLISGAQAAEWKVEPSVSLRSQYNDNVRMRTDNNNPEGSTGFTLEPRVKFAGAEQQLWDVAIDARSKITRYQDIKDGDSENVFFVFDGGRQTERSDWRLKTSYEDNTNFDTDFDTQNPDAGLLGDQTQRKTATVTPSVSWSMSETSQISFSLSDTDVSYDEVSRFYYRDYTNTSAQLVMYWLPLQNHQLGFTSSYSEYESPETNYSYDQTVLQMDYTYTINPTSDFGFSFGGRNLKSLNKDVTVACDLSGQQFPATQGECPKDFLGTPIVPVLQSFETENTGTVVSLSYSSKTERASHRYKSGRSVKPSSYGGAQEVRDASYQFSFKNTERFTSKLTLSGSKTETIGGTIGSSIYDRTRYHFEPSLNYRLTKNWNLNILYRYINIDRVNTNEVSSSNAIYINFYLHWPKLVTTY